MLRRMAVRTAGTASLGAGAQRLVDDGLDGARAASAFGAAAETAVNLLGVAGKMLRALDSTADIVVAKHVAGTDNHYGGGPIGDAEPFDIEGARGMQKEKPRFEAIPNWRPLIWNESKKPVLRQIKWVPPSKGILNDRPRRHRPLHRRLRCHRSRCRR
jgi:hypothetical protein